MKPEVFSQTIMFAGEDIIMTMIIPSMVTSIPRLQTVVDQVLNINFITFLLALTSNILAILVLFYLRQLRVTLSDHESFLNRVRDKLSDHESSLSRIRNQVSNQEPSQGRNSNPESQPNSQTPPPTDQITSSDENSTETKESDSSGPHTVDVSDSETF
jgi:hypothetical protein